MLQIMQCKKNLSGCHIKAYLVCNLNSVVWRSGIQRRMNNELRM